MRFAVPPLSARLTRPRPERLLALGVLALGLAVSALLGGWLYRGLYARAQARFEHDATALQEEIRLRLGRAVSGLIGLQALLVAQPAANDEAFGRFVEVQSRMGARDRGVRGYAFAQQVARADAQRLQAGPRERMPSLTTTAVDAGEELLVVRHAEPRAALQPLLGLDLAAQPVLRQTLERALRDGQPALSTALALPGDTQLSLVILLPLYRGDGAPASEAQRRAELAGVLLAPLSVGELLAGMDRSSAGRDLVFDLLDGPAPGAPRLYAGL